MEGHIIQILKLKSVATDIQIAHFVFIVDHHKRRKRIMDADE